jgi:hypothetical protein
MIVHSFAGRPASRLRGTALALLATGLAACGGDNLASGNPPDSTPPIDTTPPPPPVDTTPPIDTTPPPPPVDSAPPPTHVGIGLGPTQTPYQRYSREFSGSQQNGQPDSIMVVLDAARRASARITINFSGNQQWIRDENGFSITKWKQRVDRFRGKNIDSYIADGTLIGHLIMDEPSDPTNWNGKPVPQGLIEEMAKYSKDIWPNLTVIIRAWPDYLEGGNYPSLDATWIQYHSRFGDLDNFIETRLHAAQELGLAVVGGVNAIRGGPGKTSMSPSELRSWGERILEEDICLFLLFDYKEDYFARADIQAAMEHLTDIARGLPKRDCKK